MKSSHKISITWVLFFGVFTVFAQNVDRLQYPVLFTDRDYCISGDTLWFKVWLPKTEEYLGNVVRVQLNSANNNLISGVAAKSMNGWAEGFIHVPDSLSTGQYFVTAFLNALRNNPELELENKSLLVYNRFSENISEMEIVEPDEIQNDFLVHIGLSTDKEQYSPREEVKVTIDLDTNLFTKAVVKATLVDPLASEISGKRKFKMESCNPSIPGLPENNGLLLSGKVADNSGNPVSNVLVTLSAGTSQPYFDYYFVGKGDDFHFFLKDAYGNADVVFQAVSENKTGYFIQIESNYLRRKNINSVQRKVLRQEQVYFINNAVNASFAHRLFNPPGSVQNEFFEIPARFSMPFYGKPTLRVVPDEFIDLPDFREIARELLPGFQYRIKNGEIIFRMINQQQKIIFEDEPLRLINGIPVFKNELFAGLKSADISYIDLVNNERIFGDLVLKGVLEVSLKDKSNFWMAQQPNIFQLNVSFLQPDKKARHFVQQNTNRNQPDMRQVYFWELLNTASLEDFSFILSDRKGTVEISIEGFTKEKESFKASKTIEVK